jgi:hypothetical protein
MQSSTIGGVQVREERRPVLVLNRETIRRLTHFGSLGRPIAAAPSVVDCQGSAGPACSATLIGCPGELTELP